MVWFYSHSAVSLIYVAKNAKKSLKVGIKNNSFVKWQNDGVKNNSIIWWHK